MTSPDPGPVLRLVRGQATPEELAAVVVLLGYAVPAQVGVARPTRTLWSRPQLRLPLHPGPGAWVASALPR